MKKDERVFLSHVLESISKIEQFVRGYTKERFLQSAKTQDSVVRRLEVMGEAVKNLPKSLLSAHQDIPWSKMVRMRDKLIHGYFGIDLEITWDVVKRDLPDLKKKIKSLLDEIGKKSA